MYTLYIDTHYVNIVLALFKDNVLIDKIDKESSKHTEEVVVLLDRLLKSNDVRIDNLSEVIVINGPGSFTGVRIGVVIAKMLAYTKNIKLKALSYLQALALSYSGEVVVGISERNGIYGGRFNEEKELLDDYFYLSNDEKDRYLRKIELDKEVDLDKVILFMKDKNSINPHSLAPLYVKKIEVE